MSAKGRVPVCIRAMSRAVRKHTAEKLATARAETRRFGLLSALRAHTKAHQNQFTVENAKTLKRPGRAHTEGIRQGGLGQPARLHCGCLQTRAVWSLDAHRVSSAGIPDRNQTGRRRNDSGALMTAPQ
jgi:hypothetical protein